MHVTAMTRPHQPQAVKGDVANVGSMSLMGPVLWALTQHVWSSSVGSLFTTLAGTPWLRAWALVPGTPEWLINRSGYKVQKPSAGARNFSQSFWLAPPGSPNPGPGCKVACQAAIVPFPPPPPPAAGDPGRIRWVFFIRANR